MTRFLVLLFPIIFACSRLHNQVDRLSVECKIPRASAGRYLKVLDSAGQAYEAAAIKRLKATLADDDSTRTQTLTKTEGGCIPLPDTAGLVTIVDSGDRSSVTLPIPLSQDSSPQMTSVQLQTLKDFSLSLACPAEGLFADTTLQTPESLVLGGDMSGLEFHIELYKERQFVRRLFSKSVGEGHFLHNGPVAVGDLPEGAYTLKLYGRHVANGIDAELALLNADRDCDLYIVHGEAKVKGVDDSPFTVVAKGSSLTWRAEKFGEQLFLCRESRENKYTPTSAGSCQPQAYCLEADHFARVNEVIASDTGVFDYYLFVRDQLGRRSPLSCQTVIISDSKPGLSVSWDADDLKAEGSILRQPYAAVRAHAVIDHALLDARTLERNLECKVSFELRGRDELAGKSVLCTEGRCQGMMMGDYVPCDAAIAFSLAEAWDQPVVASSRLRLSVRSSDGAGHSVESEASFWINKTAWRNQVLDYAENDVNFTAMSFAMTRSGVVLVHFSDSHLQTQRLVRYGKDGWEQLRDDRRFSEVKFVQKSDGGTAARVVYLDPDNSSHEEYWKFADDGTLASTRSIEGAHGSCTSFSEGRDGILWCFGSEEVHYFADGSWHDAGDLKALRADAPTPLYVRSWRVTEDGRIFGLDVAHLLRYTPGKGWVRLDTRKPLGDRNILGLVEDEAGQVWLVADRTFGDVDALYRLNADDSFTAFAAPESLGAFTSAVADASARRLSQLKLSSYSFDFAAGTWQRRPGFPAKAAVAMGLQTNYLKPDGRTNVGFLNHGFYEDQDKPLYWPLSGLSFPCCETAQRASDSTLYFMGGVEGSNRLIRQTTLQTTKFDGSILPIQGNYALDYWIDADGVPGLLLGGGSIIRLVNNGIETLPLKLPAGVNRVAPLANGRFCVWAFHTLSVVNQDSKIEKSVALGQEQAYLCREDGKGRLWIHQGTSNRYGYFAEDGSFKAVVEPASQEYLRGVGSLQGGRTLVVGTSQTIRVVNADKATPDQRSLTLPVKAEIITFDRISSHEFLVWFQTTETSFQAFVLDSETWDFTEDKTLESLSRITGRMQIRGEKVWVSAVDHKDKHILLTRESGQWQVLAKAEQFLPWSDLSNTDIIAPDLNGRVWLMSNYPNYTLYRYDP